MKITKNKATSFFGDQILSTPDHTPDRNLLNVIRTELQFVIEDLYKEHKHIFLTAIKPGFDMLSAEVVLECTEKYKSIELYVVIPYPGHELCYSDADRVRYERIYEAATGHICLNEEFNKKAVEQHIEYMVSASSEVVLFYKEPAQEIEIMSGSKAWNMYKELEEYFAIESPIKELLQNYSDIPSFRYGREGVIFEGNNQPFPIKFSQIEKIEHEKEFLCFFLSDGLKIFASVTSNEVRVPSVRFSVN